MQDLTPCPINIVPGSIEIAGRLVEGASDTVCVCIGFMVLSLNRSGGI